jgi:hypothetical protein
VDEKLGNGARHVQGEEQGEMGLVTGGSLAVGWERRPWLVLTKTHKQQDFHFFASNVVLSLLSPLNETQRLILWCSGRRSMQLKSSAH